MGIATVCEIVVVVKDQLAMTRRCVEAITARTKVLYRLIIIDNASNDETRTYLKKLNRDRDDVTLIRNEENVGWVKGVNQGIGVSLAGFVCFMNNDAIVRTDGWLARLIAISHSEPNIGLVNPTFEVKNEGFVFDKPFVELDFCRGYCMLVKRSVIDTIGALDTAYGLGYYDDDDYSVRAIRAGFLCVRARDVFVEHVKDSTFRSLFKEEKRRYLHERNKLLFYSKWGRRLRILFVISGDSSKKHDFAGLFFSLARSQHLIYAWNVKERLGLKHINIRETVYTPTTLSIALFIKIILNKVKKRTKQFDAIFVEEGVVREIFLGPRKKIHRFNISRKRSIFDVISALHEKSKAESARLLERL
ncbi:MAG: glycosyltransferase [Candidatus Omnitrophota bacterium]